jgi:hypothetical protein
MNSVVDSPSSASGFAGDLDHPLSSGLRSLDITSAEREVVVARYKALGRTLDHHWGMIRGDNVVSPQGSFMPGTVARKVHREGDIDIDCFI